MNATQIKALIRDVPDFPKRGVLFKDITPLLADATAFRQTINLMSARIEEYDVSGLVGIESRGFILAAAIAQNLGLPLILIRKPGKLPARTQQVSYDLEYGTGQLEIHADAIAPERRYSIVDDVLATGGTAAAAASLVSQQHGTVGCYTFLMELNALGGRSRLDGAPVESLLTY